MTATKKNSAPPKIVVRNFQRAVSLDLGALQRFAESALAICLQLKHGRALNKLREIDIALISDRRMSALHREFLHEKGPTDVITFQHGEIFISAETARENAARFKTTLPREIGLYIVHGLLHLCGLEDKTSAGAAKMKSTQTRILKTAMEL